MMKNPRSAKIFLCFILLFTAPVLFAHEVGISRGNYRVVNNVVKAELVFARPEIIAALPKLDSNTDGVLIQEEIAHSGSIIKKMIVDRLAVSSGATTCSGTEENVILSEGDGLLIKASYHCPDVADALKFNLNFLDNFSRGHRHIVTATAAESKVETVAFQSNSEFQLASRSAKLSTVEVFGSLFYFGVEHILTGYDHLLFLFGLILIGGSIRQLMIVVSSFTLAHSITIGLSAFGIWAPSPIFVEPAIALSIAYIGVENWFIKNAGRRWLITFPFGLIHGFGFAGSLSEIFLPASQVPLALASFNLGVEAGQLAFLIIAMPIVLWLRRQQWFAVQGVKGLSTAIVIAGMWLLITRIG